MRHLLDWAFSSWLAAERINPCSYHHREALMASSQCFKVRHCPMRSWTRYYRQHHHTGTYRFAAMMRDAKIVTLTKKNRILLEILPLARYTATASRLRSGAPCIYCTHRIYHFCQIVHALKRPLNDTSSYTSMIFFYPTNTATQKEL